MNHVVAYKKIEIFSLAAAFVGMGLFFAFTAYKSFILHFETPRELYAEAIIEDINAKRMSEGLPALTYDESLAKAAQSKADDMAKKGYFSHNSPGGETPWFFMEKNGYNFIYAGENLGVDFFDVSELDSAWMGSPGHKANIMNLDFSETGIGVASGEYEGRKVLFYVQMFGHPDTRFALESEGQVLGTSTDSFIEEKENKADQYLANPSLVLKYSYIVLTVLLLLVSVIGAIYSWRTRTPTLRAVSYNMLAVIFIWGMFYIYSMFSFSV